MKLLVILDRQHAGKRSSPADVGACYDLDGDGVKAETGEREIDLTLGYGERAAQALEQVGVQVVRLGWPDYVGSYDERHAQAIGHARSNKEGRCLYVALHVNAGGGDYGLVEYDERSGRGGAAASTLCRALTTLPELSRGKTNALDSTERGWACIDGLYSGPANLCGVIYEPGFIDQAKHRPLWTEAGLARVGRALAQGCLTYLQG